jgi:hypothetical protein
METFYRQRFPKMDTDVSEMEAKPPNLLTAKRVKNEKEQHNFDYNGDKIPIGGGMVQKNNQINVLKTLYRIHKDRQEDIKNPKKVH